jgi:hypothetical protein
MRNNINKEYDHYNIYIYYRLEKVDKDGNKKELRDILR